MMALLSPWACILISCFSASLAEESNLSDLYPPLWEESPGQFSEYTVENGKYIINPWIYPQRMGMYKILLKQTARYFEKFGPENENNILWGLPLQHGWQYNSGRLADPSKRTDCGYDSGDRLCISTDSWWADLNYFLCALPFLAAVDSGIMGISPEQVTLLPPPKGQMKFCVNVSTCQSSFPEAMRKWNTFYKHVQIPYSSFEDLLKYLWDAHTKTLAGVKTIFDDSFEYYSKPESNFERSWFLSVDYIAVLQFPTTLTKVYEFQKSLPPRLLVNGDMAPFISDFSTNQNIVLLSLNVIREVHTWTGSLSFKIWKILMKTPAAREQLLKFLEMILQNSNPTF
ncbi:protein LEG1 homolog [Pteronotus mesoamericanus]|uniref:protein LEG1 homolog n=1 Tax=Pteronotus mesoamericanus TaxID=1884717 RepID=UPI0023EB55E8|nr:protein LEG1 homolog [Pteronotus parnellii mesoamericanus]